MNTDVNRNQGDEMTTGDLIRPEDNDWFQDYGYAKVVHIDDANITIQWASDRLLETYELTAVTCWMIKADQFVQDKH